MKLCSSGNHYTTEHFQNIAKYFQDININNDQNATSACITAAWKCFWQLQPIITNHGILLRNHGKILSSCIRKNLLCSCKTWPGSNEICHIASADSGRVWFTGYVVVSDLSSILELQNFMKSLV